MKQFLSEFTRSFCSNAGAKEIIRTTQSFLDYEGYENFYYVRIKRDGSMIYLTNRLDLAFNYWEAGLPLRASFGEEQNYSVLWENVLEIPIIDFYRLQGCFDGFSFIDRFHDSIQFASFLRGGELENSSQFYLKNYQKLRLWLRDFEWKNRGLIQHAMSYPSILPEEYLFPQTAAFYPERTLTLTYRNIRNQVSFRQLDCLHLHSKGFSRASIANFLGISTRTVETHLEAVKNCFGLCTRDDLALFAYSNPIIQSYSPRFCETS